jgi:hypothetical protein
VLSLTNSHISWIRHYSTVGSLVGLGVTDMERKTWKQFLNPAFLRLSSTETWELIHCALILPIAQSPYRESIFSVLAQFLGILTLPGLSAHSRLNYVNAIRLGNYPICMESKDMVKCLSVISLNMNSLWDVARELAEPITSHWLNLITSSWLWTTTTCKYSCKIDT